MKQQRNGLVKLQPNEVFKQKNKITIDIDLIDIPTDCFQQSNFNRAHFHILKSILNSFPHFGIVQISRAHRQSSAKKEY